MKTKQLKKILLVLALTIFSYTVSAEWTLNNTESTIDFISIKNLTIGEVHTFKTLEGSLKDNGEVNVNVSLASVDTKIPTRDERMKKELFDVAQFSKATVSTKIDSKKISDLKVGDSFIQTMPLILSIHGKTKEVDAEMRITSLTGNKILATTIKPIVVNAVDFEFVKGIDILKELAKLSSISTAVPVSANFIFEK